MINKKLDDISKFITKSREFLPEMTIEIEEKDVEESLPPNDLMRSSNSDKRNITPTGHKKAQQLPRKDTSEALIHSTRSIKLVSSSPHKKKTPTNQHHTLTSINTPKDKFTKLDENNELEFLYSKYFDLSDQL